MKHLLRVLLSLLVLLTGCWDIEESDRMEYVHAVGVDYQDGEIILHMQLANLATLGVPEVSELAKNELSIATGRGDSVSSILHEIYQSAQRELYWGHATFLVLTEAALQHGKLQETIDILNRFPETRYRINVFASKDQLTDILKVSTLFQESPVLTRITDLENTYAQNSFVKQVSVRELIIQLNEPGYNAIIPAINVVDDTWENAQEKIPMIQDIGVAQISSTDIQGFIVDQDAKGLRWIQDSVRNNVTLYEDDQPFADIIVFKPSASFSIDVTGGKPTFHVSIEAIGAVNEMLKETDQDVLIETLEQTIQEEVMQTYTKALETGGDIYRLSEQLYRHELRTWQTLEEEGQIPLEQDSLVVDVEIDINHEKVDDTRPVLE